MANRYTTLEPTESGEPQVIVSEEPIDYLEGLARWVREDDVEFVDSAPGGDDKQGEVTTPADDQASSDQSTTDSSPGAVEKPHANAAKAEWVAYAESKGFNVDGLTVAEIKELVED